MEAPLEVTRSEGLPPELVGDDEELARYCDLKAVSGGKVRKQAFVQTKNFPAELSVDRIRYCSPSARVARESDSMGKKRAHVVLVTGTVRDRLPQARVLAVRTDDNVAHAEIHTAPDGPPMETKEAFVQADVWEAHNDVCELLASIATIPPEYTRPADKPPT